jgi:hypothetical protein
VGKVDDAEIVALAVAQAMTGIVSDRRFLGTIGRLLPGFFPDLPDQTQYNRRLRRLTPHITTVQLMLAELIAEGRYGKTTAVSAGGPRAGHEDGVRAPSRVRVAVGGDHVDRWQVRDDRRDGQGLGAPGGGR